MSITSEIRTSSLLADPYDPGVNAENFSLDLFLAQFDPRLMASSEGRRALCALNPMLFALIYMRKHLKNEDGVITFADAHFLWARLARRWIGPSRGPRQDRRAVVAPRATGKSTWCFLILPMWAGAFGHARFAAAFADSGAQAELHLATFKRELSDNALLRSDFPDFCEPARRHNGKTINDSQNMLYAKSGFAFAARGIDSTSLGMKVDEVRPDLLIFDDIEPPESTYSPFQRDKRLSTVQNAIMPLNERARVIFSGTVTMPGSIIHELVRDSKGEEVEDWVKDEQIKTYHTRPIIVREDGTERSVWPQKWSMDYLNSIRHTRSFKLNFDNDPKGREGDYWSAEDIIYGVPPNITKWFLFVDPPVTMKTRSDLCGLTVVGYAPAARGSVTRDELKTYGADHLREALLAHEIEDGKTTRLSRVCVLASYGVKLTGAPLKKHILGVLEKWPKISAVVLESNNGGDLWMDVLNDLPVKLVTYGATEAKETRFARVLDWCQKRRISFADVFPQLEDQMLGFPRLAHDDVLDSFCGAALRLLTPRHAQRDGTVTPR
jgi:hypothetical protein